MNHRILGAILLGLVSSASLAACAPNPADDVPAAVDPAAVDSAAQAPAEAAPVEAATEAVADPAAAGALPVGEFPLTGLVQFFASKVTKNHTVVFKTWEGSYVSDGTAAGTKLNFSVDLASLEVDNGQSERLQSHLQTPDFFDVANYPKATFTSSSFAEGVDAAIFANAEGATHTVTGTLDIHGMQKEVSFPITVSDDGAGNVGAKAKFAVDRKDFGLVYPGAPDDLIRDEVVIEVDASMVVAG